MDAPPPARAPAFPATLRFRWPWRSYQARILEGLEHRLRDDHFHVVAAPGAGKTVLGLEAVRRLQRPALILAPTLALRDQWIARFRTDFLADPAVPPPAASLTSTDPTQPATLTVVTYQSLDRAVSRGGLAPLVAGLRAAGTNTLVLDEAHHLRRRWWTTLDAVRRALPGLRTIALTATPPYDAPQLEWNRYCAACGEVDDEIATPELVLNGDLCPHQDYLYFNAPTAREAARLDERAGQIASFLRDLALDAPLIAALESLPGVRSRIPDPALLLEQRDFLLAVAVFLHHARGVVPRALLENLGLDDTPLPPFHTGWGEVLLNGLLGETPDPAHAPVAALRDPLRARLRHLGAWDRRRVVLGTGPRLTRLLRHSAAKLRSIADIVELERRELGDRLRLVVLTDHIRERDFEQAWSLDDPHVPLGAVPAFEHLRRLRLPGVRPALLCGRLAVLPAAAVSAWSPADTPEGLVLEPLAADPGFVSVRAAGRPLTTLVADFTRLLSAGDINVLVGTAALLGEGWDAPAVNALILATTAGTHVSSNQLRGRAIRADPAWTGKTANLWHLACLDPHPPPPPPTGLATPPTESGAAAGGDDWEILTRRFLTFAAPAFDESVIRNGIERLGIPPPAIGDADRLNALMCSRAAAREALACQWRAATDLRTPTKARLASDALIPRTLLRRPAVVRRLPGTAGWLGWWARWREARFTRRLVRAVLTALIEAKVIAPAGGEPEPRVTPFPRHLRVRLDGADARTEALFLQALRDVLDPLSSPTHVLVRGHEVHGVPRCLGGRRRDAERFQRAWHRQVGRARLLSTRTGPGRAALLRAQARFLASQDGTGFETQRVWR